MAFSVDGSSREAIQAIQFELWPDCQTGCPFCYLNGTTRTTTVLQKKRNLEDALKTIKDKSIMQDYNAVGLIGGEFFQGQLKDLTSEWSKLLGQLCLLLEMHQIKEVWIASSLIDILRPDLIGALYAFNRLLLQADQRVTLCTSFDTIGRFRYDFDIETEPEEVIEQVMHELHCNTIDELKKALLYNPEKVQEWLDEIKFIKTNYKNITIHVQVILTQDVIEKLIENPNYFDFITDLGCIIDFRYPSITRADCPTATVIKDYRTLLLAKYKMFPPKFFIEDCSMFLKFLKVFAEKYGLEKVRNLIHQPEMRSRRLKIYIDNAEIKDRWNDERDVYLPCGHLVDGLCYINDDTHCIYCDIEKFIENQENI